MEKMHEHAKHKQSPAKGGDAFRIFIKAYPYYFNNKK
jgi:hypothetical protein